jgi:hypothetical protein
MSKEFLLCIFLFTSCSQPGNQAQPRFTQKLSTDHSSRADTSQLDTTVEYIDRDSVFVNDRISFFTTAKDLRKYLGKPDSTAIITYDCGGFFSWDGKVRGYYYKGTVFEENNDTVVLRKINFRDKTIKLKTPKLILSKNTTLEEFARVYPVAFKSSYDWSDETGKKYRLLRIQPKPNYDDEWVLTFDANQLVEIEYWVPC